MHSSSGQWVYLTLTLFYCTRIWVNTNKSDQRPNVLRRHTGERFTVCPSTPSSTGTHTHIHKHSLPHTHTHTVRLPLSPLMLQVLRQQPHWWKMDDVKRREEWSRRRRSWTGSWETEQCDQPSVCLLLLEHTHTPIIKECLRPRSGISFLFQHKVLTVVHLLRYFSRLEFFTQWGYD